MWNIKEAKLMEFDPSVIALCPLEYRPTSEQESAHAQYKWSRFRDKKFVKLHRNIGEFFKECLSEIEPLPDRFEKEELLKLMMDISTWVIHYDKELRNLVLKIGNNYPQHPLPSERAYRFVGALKSFSGLYARRGNAANKKFLVGALKSDIPYSTFSTFVLGTYTTSYFFEYRARATEQHFRHHRLFVRARPHLHWRKEALEDYHEMLKPTIQAYKDFSKSKCKLWWLITLWNSNDLKDFAQTPQFLSSEKIDKKQFEAISKEYTDNLEKLRELLFGLDPEVFMPIMNADAATSSMWNDMLWLRLSR
jgi:hypothetical protein